MSEPDRFGNWLRPSSAGLFGLPRAGLAVVAGGVVVAFLCLARGFYVAFWITLALTAVVVLVAIVPFGGVTLWQRASRSLDDAARRRRGSSMYVTGAMSTLPAEAINRLPGALVNVDAVEGTDGLGRPYSLLHHKFTHLLAAVVGCTPDGAGMQDQDVVNTQVANFGAWISTLPVEDGLQGSTIVVDSASESTAGMVQEIIDSTVPTAPAHARAVIEAAAGQLPGRTATLSVYATMVYSIRELVGRNDDITGAAAEVAARLPRQTALLEMAGGGTVQPLVDHQLARVAELAYMPTRDRELALDELSGLAARRSFENAGPGFFDDSQPGRVVYHDGVASMTVMMTVPPASHITARSFDRMFGPDPKFMRKRVTIFYRPIDPGQGRKDVDREVKNAAWRMSTRSGRPTSFDVQTKAVAEKTEQELASGARLSMFSLMLTVTFPADADSVREATTRVKSIFNELIMEYRFVEHGKAAAFHCTLPFGVLPWKYNSAPLWLQQAL